MSTKENADEFAKITDEVHDVFARHGVIGMVSFVKVSNVTRCEDGTYDYQWDGEATVLADPSVDLVTITAAIDSLQQKQSAVAIMLAQTKAEIGSAAKELTEQLQATSSN